MVENKTKMSVIIYVIQTKRTYQHKSLLFIPCAEIWLAVSTVAPPAH